MSTNEMTEEQVVKARVRKILRDYMKTPGATMETDVFMATVNEIIAARAQGFREGVEDVKREALRHIHANDPMGNLLAWIATQTEEG